MSSFNLPPGTTTADIDRHFGGDDSQDAPYLVDVPTDIYFQMVPHITLQSAQRHAREVGGVVLDAATNDQIVDRLPFVGAALPMREPVIVTKNDDESEDVQW